MHHGIYVFINRQSGTAMDLIGDNNLLVGMPPNESDSQKWEVAPLGAGHTIRNVKTGKYLTILRATREEPVVATSFPVAWYMKKIFVIEEDTAFFEIRWPNTEFMFEVADNGHNAPWSQYPSAEGYVQRCRLWRAVCYHVFSGIRGPYPERNLISFSIPVGSAPPKPRIPRPLPRSVLKNANRFHSNQIAPAYFGNEFSTSNARQTVPRVGR